MHRLRPVVPRRGQEAVLVRVVGLGVGFGIGLGLGLGLGVGLGLGSGLDPHPHPNQERAEERADKGRAELAAAAPPPLARARSARYEALLKTSNPNPVAARVFGEIEQLFAKADRDASGLVSLPEFCAVLTTFGVYDAPEAAGLALANLRYKEGRAQGDANLDVDEFCELLLQYEDVRVSHVFPPGGCATFRFLPTSLQLDVVCRVGFLPAAAAILATSITLGGF